MVTQAAGSVIVAPNVLMNLVALGLREVPGIARPGNVPRAHGQHRSDGIVEAGDPRITRVGKLLRRTAVDELPQLWHVLRGEMSLVGPRPPLPEEVAEYEDWQFDRLEVSPGVTGLWQVSGRSELSFDECVRLDLFYIENWSLAYELFILGKTIPVLLSQRGAY